MGKVGGLEGQGGPVAFTLIPVHMALWTRGQSMHWHNGSRQAAGHTQKRKLTLATVGDNED